MAQRGRKSADALALLSPARVLETIQRPEPPYDLTDEQADVWRQIVSGLPADWFPRETHTLLVQYCRHAVAAKRIAQLIALEEQADPFIPVNYCDLLKMQDRESKAMGQLATRMRITQQSTMRVDMVKKPKQSAKPWEQ
jgi:hypothetical protein